VFASRLCLGLVLLAAGGCASGGSATLAQKFVRQGTPAVDLGGTRPDSFRTKVKAPPQHASISSVASRVSSGASSIEAVQPALRDALFRLRFEPTVANHIEVARVYRRLGIMDTAYDYLKEGLAINGNDPVAYDALARHWRDWGQPGEGLTLAYRAVALAPEWSTAHNTLGTLLFALGQRTEARKRFEMALGLQPGAPWVLQNLCTAYQAEGRTREAIATCRQAAAAARKPARPKESR
jgi:Flp pilus assembly protein TadD